jgi:HK97 family phage major capsid protein
MTEAEARAAIAYLTACLQDIHGGAEARAAAAPEGERAAAGELTTDERTRWDAGVAEIERLRTVVTRHAQLAELSRLPAQTEPGTPDFQVNRGESRTNPFDTSDLRYGAPAGEIRARALSALESVRGITDENRSAATALVEDHDTPRGDLARHLLATGSDEYRAAFAKILSDQAWALTAGEARAMSESRAVTLGGTAGYAIPFVLDPTIINTNAGSANPLRQISTVKTTVAKTWHGVTSAGVTASYDDESSEAADGSPTLGQPAIPAELAKCLVPFSFEAGEDWVSMEADVRAMVAEAKDDLEATKFTVGAGAASHEPKGVITAVSAVAGSKVSPLTAETFAVGDVYNLEAQATPKSRRNGSFMANKLIYNKIRQFDTNGGSAMWERIGAGQPPELLGYGAYEASDMDGVWDVSVTAANYILLFGDFRNFTIVDRVGMTFELVQNLFATANNRPNGQRAFLAHWRSGSDVVNADAFRVLNLATTA